jgi:hypothetical protein
MECKIIDFAFFLSVGPSGLSVILSEAKNLSGSSTATEILRSFHSLRMTVGRISQFLSEFHILLKNLPESA